MATHATKITRYAMSGGLNTAVGYGSILLFGAMGVNPYLANTLGYLLGICLSFFLHRQWVFQDRNTLGPKLLLQYITSYLLAYLANLTVLYFLVQTNMPTPGAQLLSAVTYSLTFFLLLNSIVFRNPSTHHHEQNLLGRLLSIDFIAPLLFCSIGISIWLSAPSGGTFWWSEAPRNALNGAFILDLIKAAPFSDPVGWAEAYYRQYPALTILFYPPLFHVMLAVWFALFGVSQFAANALLGLMFFLLLQGSFLLVRQFSCDRWALATSLALAAIPQYTLWGRQIMLEIPMLAFLAWSLYFSVLYIRDNKLPYFVAAIFLSIASLYTKQTSLIIIITMGGHILWHRWRDLIYSRHAIATIILGILALIPLLWIQLSFGSFNLVSVVERDDIGLSRSDISTWLWYLNMLPDAIGWPLVSLLIIGAVSLIYGRRLAEKNVPHDQRPFWLMLSMLLASYLFFTLISLKELRHGMPLYYCLIVFLVPQIRYLFPGKLTAGLASATILIIYTYTLQTQNLPAIGGYNQAAQFIQNHVENESRVVFAGNRDSHFIFNMRAMDSHKKIQTIRADRLFLNVNIMPELGLNPKSMSKDEIQNLLQKTGVGYVVTVADFWTHEPVMKTFSDLLKSSSFSEIKSFQIRGGLGPNEVKLVAYKANYRLPKNPVDAPLRLESIQRTINN